jgi:hypothetical protein
MTDKVENMKLVTDVTTLIAGRQYWLFNKIDRITKLSECMSQMQHLYFEDRIWAMPDNNQAMEHWKIYGPISPPDFEAIEKAGSHGLAAGVTIDELANFIRTVDGKHDMSAGVLAEHIYNWLIGKEEFATPDSQCMPSTQEPKYGIRDNRLFNRDTGEFIPTNEPLFLLRARDRLALLSLIHYSSLCVRHAGEQQALSVGERIKDFDEFARKHPRGMKYPDTSMQ